MPARFSVSQYLKERRLRAALYKLIILGVSLTAISVVSVRGLWRSRANAPQQEQQAAAPKPTPIRVDSALLTITKRGFEPSAFSHPAGKLFVLVENRSGLNQMKLRVDRAGGGRLLDVTVPGEQLDWADLLDLPAGDYVVTEANHSSWICRITFTAH